jgi:hypothetical protein
MYSNQPGEYQVHLFNPKHRTSGSFIQPNLENIRFMYSTQPGVQLVNLFNHPGEFQVYYTTQPGEYKVHLFKPTRRTSGSFAQINLENIRFIYSTQPGEKRLIDSGQPGDHQVH